VERTRAWRNRKSFESPHQVAVSTFLRQAPTFGANAAATAMAVAVIDGPYDAAALAGVLAHAPVSLGNGICAISPNSACDHGTFIMGLLGARPDAVVPGQCPEAKLLHFPLFLDDAAPSASVAALADAITVAVSAGARIINLSLAIVGDEAQAHHGLSAALERVEASGAIIVAAAGNFGRPAGGQILTHWATIPVVALNVLGNIVPSGLSGYLTPEIGCRGVAALGDEVLGYGAGAKLIRMSGTSVATAVATGILARVWSSRPDATRADIFTAVAALRLKDGVTPPALDSAQLLGALNAIQSTPNRATPLAAQPACATQYRCVGGKWIMETKSYSNNAIAAGLDSPMIARSRPVTLAGEARECNCDAPGCAGNRAATPTYDGGFVYAIGTIEVDYPNLAIEREMQALAHDMRITITPDPHLPMKLSDDRRWQYAVLSHDRSRTRYIARLLSWRLTIEDNPVFVLKPRENDFDGLIDCLKRSKFSSQRGDKGKSSENTFAPSEDLDVVVGVRGPQTADGIELFVDHFFNIELDQLAPKRDSGLYGYLAQLSDNFGLTDQERAYNFLAARYKLPYGKLEKDLKEYELAAAPTILSALSGPIGSNRIVDVVLTFRGTKTMLERKYFIRVDVTHEFPMLVKGLTAYLDR
jgi:hypothetical protein